MPVPNPMPGQPQTTTTAGTPPTGYGGGSMGGNFLTTGAGSATGGNQQNMAAAGGIVPIQGTGANPAYNANTAAVGGNQTAGFQYGMGDSGAIDQSKIAGAVMPNMSVDKGENYMQNMQDAYYNQAKSRLDPQWQQRQADLETQVQNMGLTRGSEAWNREMDNLSRGRNDAYGSAMNTAILNSGAEAQRRQGMDIAAGNFGNQATQQNFENELTSQTQQNAQQNQQYTQDLGRANLNNTALAAQQGAAQGWKSIDAQNNASQAGLAAAQAQAGATMGSAQLQAALQQRRIENEERDWTYKTGKDMALTPLDIQERLSKLYSGPATNFQQVQTPGVPGYQTGMNTGQQQINSSIADAAGGNSIDWGKLGGSLGGIFTGQPQQLSGPGMT